MSIVPHGHTLPEALYSSQQVREIDRRIIEAGTPGWVLMQRAARATFAALTERWPDAKSVCVFCGRGNNGGDGFLVARLAADRGMSVSLVQLGFSDADSNTSSSHAAEKTDAQRARAAFLQTGLSTIAWADIQASDSALELIASADVVVDAMLGTGLSGSLRPEFSAAITLINEAAGNIVAVDVPSGLCSDTGLALGERAVCADLTVTFIGLKKGLFTAEARGYTGEIVFDNLQADPAILRSHPHAARLSRLASIAPLIPRRSHNAFKNSSGHLLVIGGNHGMGGAPLLSAMAAIRGGAGLASVATRPENCAAIVASQPELMAKGIDKASDILPLLEKANTVVIGPGLGQDAWAQQLLVHSLLYMLEEQAELTSTVNLLLDADALNLVAAKADIRALFTQLQEKNLQTVLTPHPGEAARLIGEKTPDRFATIAKLLNRFGQQPNLTVVLKGAGTLVADADQTSACPYGNAALATAGTGDVLSGVIGAFLAQGLTAFEAAELGVCLHALAADHYEQEFGSRGMTASDLPLLLVDLMNNLDDAGE